MPDRWSLDGDWIDSCSCDTGCPCLFYSDPTQGHCDGMDAFHVRKGHYGKVVLDGLNVVMMAKAPGNFWKGNWTSAVYLDDRASPEQRKALQTIMTGKVGGAPALLAGLISNLKGVKVTSVKINAAKHWVSVEGILEYQVKSSEGANKKKPILISNHPLEPAVGPVKEGVGVKSHFKDYGIEFDNTGRDGKWADFHFEGP